MATGERVDPYANFNFRVEIDGIVQVAASEVSGLQSTIEAIEYREGGQNATDRKLPGRTQHSNIVLKWGLTDRREVYQWWINAVNGNVERKSGSVIVLDRQGQEKVRWNFVDAWPAKWDGPTLNATANEVAFETLELAHEGVERD